MSVDLKCGRERGSVSERGKIRNWGCGGLSGTWASVGGGVAGDLLSTANLSDPDQATEAHCVVGERSATGLRLMIKANYRLFSRAGMRVPRLRTL